VTLELFKVFDLLLSTVDRDRRTYLDLVWPLADRVFRWSAARSSIKDPPHRF